MDGGKEQVRASLEVALGRWQSMQHSDLDEAGEDADRFQLAFYQFIDHVRSFVLAMEHPPQSVNDARGKPEFSWLFAALPDPLLIPFETELDTVLTERELEVDSSEQG